MRKAVRVTLNNFGSQISEFLVSKVAHLMKDCVAALADHNDVGWRVVGMIPVFVVPVQSMLRSADSAARVCWNLCHWHLTPELSRAAAAG